MMRQGHNLSPATAARAIHRLISKTGLSRFHHFSFQED